MSLHLREELTHTSNKNTATIKFQKPIFLRLMRFGCREGGIVLKGKFESTAELDIFPVIPMTTDARRGGTVAD